MTRGELLERLSPSEYAYWIAYMTREPRGDRRIDLNFGWLIYNVRRMMGDKKATMQESTLCFERKTSAQTDSERVQPLSSKELANTFRAFAKSVNSSAKKGTKK